MNGITNSFACVTNWNWFSTFSPPSKERLDFNAWIIAKKIKLAWKMNYWIVREGSIFLKIKSVRAKKLRSLHSTPSLRNRPIARNKRLTDIFITTIAKSFSVIRFGIGNPFVNSFSQVTLYRYFWRRTL